MGFLDGIIASTVSSAVSSVVNTTVNSAISSAIEVNKEQRLAQIRNQPKPQVILPECPNCLGINSEASPNCPFCGSLLVRLADDHTVSNSTPTA